MTWSRACALGAVFALHALMIYLLIDGLKMRLSQPSESVIEAFIGSLPQPERPSPVPVIPGVTSITPTAPVPEVAIDSPVVEVTPAQSSPPIQSNGNAIAQFSRLTVLSRINPEYPPRAKRRREEGSVTLHILVGPDGAPQVVRVMESSGHSLLDEAARAAVLRWRFAAATRNQLPIASWASITFAFSLDRGVE